MASHVSLARTNDDCVTLQLPIAKDHIRKMDLCDGPDEQSYTIYRLMPLVQDWPAAKIPDGPNPRSHEAECLRSSVANAIRSTLIDSPEDFHLANRGGCLLADSLKFDPDRQQVTIFLTDLENQGMADGATSNKVIAALQEEALTTADLDDRELILSSLGRARFNVEVVVGLTDRDRIMSLVRGRNTSIQVRPWSLADFDKKFDWLKTLIDRKGGPFRDKVGWEENSAKDTTVLDVISIMTLFHPIFDEPAERRRRTPSVAFSSKGSNDKRVTDPKLEEGFKQLSNVLEDILDLHDYVFANFHAVYEKFCKEYRGQQIARLATKRKKGFENKSTTLPLTGLVSEYRIDKGVLFPLLASLRCLLDFEDEETKWKVDPKKFFDECGPDLLAHLFEQYELCGNNPATLGKSRIVYSTLHDKARLLLTESYDDAEATS